MLLPDLIRVESEGMVEGISYFEKRRDFLQVGVKTSNFQKDFVIELFLKKFKGGGLVACFDWVVFTPERKLKATVYLSMRAS